MVVQSVPGLRLGTARFESMRKASDPIASRAESGEEWSLPGRSNGTWRTDFYCMKRTPNHALDRGKSMHRTSGQRDHGQ